MNSAHKSNRLIPSEHGLRSPTSRIKQLEKLGVKFGTYDFVVALAGNPNTGKSTVFNSLTGLRQHTGNWPGKTVSRAEGGFNFKDKSYKLVDLPGTYSLLSTSEDEEIARNFILFGQPDVTVVVADATRLERNLNLVLQILEITPKAVLCLNLMDEAKRKGIEIDTEKLQQELGIPVVATTARYGDGMEKLLETIEKVATNKWESPKIDSIPVPDSIKEAINTIEKDLKSIYPNLPNTRWIALRLLEGDIRIREALVNNELDNMIAAYNQPPLDLGKQLADINKESETA